jgi:hypothetical protein
MDDEIRSVGAHAVPYRAHQAAGVQLGLRQDAAGQRDPETVNRAAQQQVGLAECHAASRRRHVHAQRAEPLVPWLQRRVQQPRLRQFCQRLRQASAVETGLAAHRK